LHRENTHLAASIEPPNGQDSGMPLPDLIERLPALVNGNPAVLRRGRYLSTDMMIEVGTTPFYLSIVQGRIESLSRGPLVMRSWSFAIRGREDAWRQFWARHPAPGFHDIFALAKFGEFHIEGDIRPLMTNLLYFKALLEAPRTLADDVPR
jgi:hypothetical protein